jgi:hypothetical protein
VEPGASGPARLHSALEAMLRIREGFSRTHWFVVSGLLLVFTGLTLAACLDGSASDLRERHILAATMGTITGPFTGAIARPSQSSCLRCGWELLPYCGGILAAAFCLQMFPSFLRRGARLSCWVLGWLAWFGGGVLSLMYAFS